jgi:hypothetical protein
MGTYLKGDYAQVAVGGRRYRAFFSAGGDYNAANLRRDSGPKPLVVSPHFGDLLSTVRLFLTDKFLGATAARASEADKVRLGFAHLMGRNCHLSATAKTDGILTCVEGVQQEVLVSGSHVVSAAKTAQGRTGVTPCGLVALVRSVPTFRHCKINRGGPRAFLTVEAFLLGSPAAYRRPFTIFCYLPLSVAGILVLEIIHEFGRERLEKINLLSIKHASLLARFTKRDKLA